MVSAKAGYYKPSSANNLVLTKVGDQIPSSWKYIGPTNPTNWPVTVFASGGAAPTVSAPAPTYVVPPASTDGTTEVTPASGGGLYVTSDGTYVQTSEAGGGPAASWTQVDPSTIAPGTTVINDPLVGTGFTTQGSVERSSTGGTYITTNGEYLSVPAGQQVPAGWIDTSVANIDTTGKTVYQAPDAKAVAENAQFIQLITSIVTIAGIGGLAYLGYQVISDPDSVISTLKRMNMFKDLLGDAAQIAGFMVVLAGIGFATYEFTTTYVANDYDIAKTLGDLVSSLILTVLESVGDAIVDLFSKIGSAIASAIF